MTPLEIGILVGAIALVVFTVAYNVVRKRCGRSGCGCTSQDKKKNGACTGICSHCGADCPYKRQ